MNHACLSPSLLSEKASAQQSPFPRRQMDDKRDVVLPKVSRVRSIDSAATGSIHDLSRRCNSCNV